MERTDSAGVAPATLRSTWIWALLLGVGLATVLLKPPAALVDVAREAAPRLLRGEVALDAPELAATTLYAALILFKPLLVIGAILLLEFRFTPENGKGNRKTAWLINGAFAMFVFGLWALMRGFDMRPEPLLRIDPGDGPIPAWLLSILVLLVTLFVFDFLEYWIHRAQHRFAFLWRFHAVHHSVDVDVLHNYRHPLDHLPLILFVALPQAWLIDISEGQFYLIIAFTSLQTHLNHTRLPIHLGPFSRIFTDNRYHFVHHSRDPALHNKNFAGRFPILDKMFGTQAPRPDHLVETGLPASGSPTSFGDYLLLRLPPRQPRAGPNE